jgi:hypothetical protein
MCCFSGTVDEVTDTKIFAARRPQDRQVLIYEMKVSAGQPVAMVLPIPTPARAPDDAVRFVSLEGYPELFDDLEAAFPRLLLGRSGGERSVVDDVDRLVVHQVGAFVASFVPSLDDFERIDPRFRISTVLFECVPDYVGWGYAVFQLAMPPGRLTRIHPMAFEFSTRHPDRLFFPTLHIHDGGLPPTAQFAHALYAQGKGPRSWRKAHSLKQFVDPLRAAGLIDVGAATWRTEITGQQRNADTWA